MCARHYFESFTCINSFNPPNNPMDMVAASYSQIVQKENNRVREEKGRITKQMGKILQ